IQSAVSKQLDHTGVEEPLEVLGLSAIAPDLASSATVEARGRQLLDTSPKTTDPSKMRYEAVTRLMLPSLISTNCLSSL
ncbi:MAG TPA: hypothetical protein V6C91_14045, partial [Coleofasciculaceae cyanobacterium]